MSPFRRLWGPHGLSRGFDSPLAIALAAGAVYAVLSVPGLRWGLPSRARSALYGASYVDAVGSGQERLFVTGPLQSYQVDECSTLIPLARMDPAHLQFNPKWFHWGSLHLYVVGAVLYGAKLAGVIALTPDRQFYLDNPAELAAVYLVARWVSWAMGLGSVVLLTVLARRVAQGVVALSSVLLFATAPLVVMYAGFATVDMAVVFWALLAACLAGVGRPAPPRDSALVLSFIAAGCAASVKFHGAMALVLPLVQAWIWRRRFVALGVACFLAAFVVGSPYAVLDWPRFRQDVAWQWAHVRTGHGLTFLGTKPGLVHHWWETMPSAASPLTTLLLGGAFVWGLVRPRRERIPVVLFLALFWVQLARSSLKFARYLLPIMPLHVLLAGWVVAEARSRWVRHAGVACMVLAIISQIVLSWGHREAFQAPDVRDRASAWLMDRGAPGDVVALPGKPYFATPPISRQVFSVSVTPLQIDSIRAVNPRFYVLTDYDTEPIRRAPGALREEAAAVAWLLKERDAASVHTFSGAPCPPRVVSWGRVFLPHDMRYHCPTIWIVEP